MRTASLYDETMLATERDRQIVLTIGRFKQLTFAQIQELIFRDAKSRTSADRALTRLISSKYLALVGRRPRGGDGRGSGPNVYQLGSKGWQLCGREGRYWPSRSIEHHTLAIADVYLSIKQAEHDGLLSVVTYETEPDTWQEVHGAKLTPDLYVQLSVPSKRATVALWVEVDTGTERQKQVKDKLARYWHAYQFADNESMPVFPLVVFTTPDEQRSGDVKRWIASGPREARELFAVVEAKALNAFIL